MTSICPIFVLGSARHGTTWLGNLLSNHREISGVTHASHWGQVEARLLSTRRFAGDLRDGRRFVRFVESYAAADFARAAGATRQDLYALRHQSAYEIQLSLLDRLASAAGHRYWVTKLEPQFFHQPRELAEFLRQLDVRYPTCRFVSIQRPLAPVLESYLEMQTSESRRRQTPLASFVASGLQTARYALHRRGIQRLIAQRQGLAVDFDALRADTAGEFARICDYLGVSHDTQALSLPWQKNASAGAGALPQRRKQFLAWWGTHVWLPLFGSLPLVARILLRAWDRAKGNGCPWYYRILQLEQLPDSLRGELVQSQETHLLNLLFGGDAVAATSTKCQRLAGLTMERR